MNTIVYDIIVGTFATIGLLATSVAFITLVWVIVLALKGEL